MNTPLLDIGPGEFRNTKPLARRYEILKEGDRVQLLARTEAHDPRFRVGQVYQVVWCGFATADPSTGVAYSITIADKDGFRESFFSYYLFRVEANR